MSLRSWWKSRTEGPLITDPGRKMWELEDSDTGRKIKLEDLWVIVLVLVATIYTVIALLTK